MPYEGTVRLSVGTRESFAVLRSRANRLARRWLRVCATSRPPPLLSQSPGLAPMVAPWPPKAPCPTEAPTAQGVPVQPRRPLTKPVLPQADAPLPPGLPARAGQCGFSREEVQQILQERTELKANLFLLKEELAYFQR